MFNLERDIIQSPWGSILDKNIPALFWEDPVLIALWKNLPFFSPYSQELDLFLGEFNSHLKSMKKDFSDNNVTRAYSEVYFFTQIQANIMNYISLLKGNIEKIELMIVILESYTKDSLEKEAKGKLSALEEERKERQSKIDKNYEDKKSLTTTEMKFVQISLNQIDKEIDNKISFITGQKLTNSISNNLKKDPYINEIKRKKLVLETTLSYLNNIFKVSQEEVNTHKKIIDNLMFLYNQTK